MVKTGAGFTHSEKGKLEAQKDSKTLNLEENNKMLAWPETRAILLTLI